MYFVKTAGNLKHGESQHDRGSEAEEVGTHLVYELGEDVTVNIAANLGQEEPVAQTELPAALSDLAVLKLNVTTTSSQPLISPSPSCWRSDSG